MRIPSADPGNGPLDDPSVADPAAATFVTDPSSAELTAAERAIWAAFPRGELVDVRPVAAETGDGDRALAPGAADAIHSTGAVEATYSTDPADTIRSTGAGKATYSTDPADTIRSTGATSTAGPATAAGSATAAGPATAVGAGTPVRIDGREAVHDPAAFEGWETWDASRVVRASVLAELLLGEPNAAPGRVPALRLRGAKITGRLDLAHGRVSVPIMLRECVFEETPLLADAATGSIEVSGSLLPGLVAPGIRTSGALILTGNRFTGPVTLADARVEGSLSLARSRFTRAPAGRLALDIHRGEVSGNLDGFEITVDGETGLNNAHVGGLIRLGGARLRAPGGLALAAGGLTVDGGVFCLHGFTAEGPLRLVGARLGANLTFAGATLHNPDGVALLLDGAVIGTLEGNRGFRCTGEIRMVGAQVAMRINLSEAELEAGVTGHALTADAVRVGDAVILIRLRASGGLRLRMARITGRLHLTEARIDNPGGYAVRASRSEIGSDVFATGMTAIGQVRFAGSRIGGRLELAGARLSSPGDVALSATQMVAGRLDLLSAVGLEPPPFLAGKRLVTAIEGVVDLRHAQIGVLRDDPAAWPAPSERRRPEKARPKPAELNLTGTNQTGNEQTGTGTGQTGSGIGQTVSETEQTRTEQTRTEQTRTEQTRTEQTRTAPADDKQTRFQLDGLTYQALEPRLPARERLRWLAADAGGYQPQPYEQLAAEYNRIGQYTDARRVLYAKERRSRAGLTRFGRVWNLLQDVTVAYGYQPWRAAVWLVVLLAIGSTLYGRYEPAPLRPGEAPAFNPVAYTLDLMLPLVDLGQERAYDPTGALLQWVSYLFVAAGFLLATTIAAGVARVLSRN
jgi:hypothetical protein